MIIWVEKIFLYSSSVYSCHLFSISSASVRSIPFLSFIDRKASSILGSGRSPGERNGNPLQYACLKNPLDSEAWQATYSPRGHKESDTTEHIALHFTSMYGYHIFSISSASVRSIPFLSFILPIFARNVPLLL